MGVLLNGKEIFDRIEQVRLEKSMSKIKLAKEVGMSPSNFYDTMTLLQKNKIRYHNIIKIVDYLGIDLGIRF